MITAQNPITGGQMNLASNIGVNEVVTSEDGTMFEVTAVNGGQATLQALEVEEDWGE